MFCSRCIFFLQSRSYILLIVVIILVAATLIYNSEHISYHYDRIVERVRQIPSIFPEPVNCTTQPERTGHDKVAEWYPDIVAPGNHFYLLESTNSSYGFFLNSRQACSIESTARANNNSEVYFLISSKTYNDDVMLWTVSQYPNVHLIHMNIDSFLEDTPLIDLLTSGRLAKSKFRKEHTSDVLRYATLYRYSGTYLDLDFVVMTSLEHLYNYVGAEDDKNMAAGVINFSDNVTGRELAKQCAELLSKKFSTYIWRQNGPMIVDEVTKNRCNTSISALMTEQNCHDYRAIPRQYFYPIFYPSWKKYFEEKGADDVMKSIKDSYAVHVWNKMSVGTTITKSMDVPYIRLAKEYCPKVFENSGETF